MRTWWHAQFRMNRSYPLSFLDYSLSIHNFEITWLLHLIIIYGLLLSNSSFMYCIFCHARVCCSIKLSTKIRILHRKLSNSYCLIIEYKRKEMLVGWELIDQLYFIFHYWQVERMWISASAQLMLSTSCIHRFQESRLLLMPLEYFYGDICWCLNVEYVESATICPTVTLCWVQESQTIGPCKLFHCDYLSLSQLFINFIVIIFLITSEM